MHLSSKKEKEILKEFVSYLDDFFSRIKEKKIELYFHTGESMGFFLKLEDLSFLSKEYIQININFTNKFNIKEVIDLDYNSYYKDNFISLKNSVNNFFKNIEDTKEWIKLYNLDGKLNDIYISFDKVNYVIKNFLKYKNI